MPILAAELSWADPWLCVVVVVGTILLLCIIVEGVVQRSDRNMVRRIRRRAWSWAERGSPRRPGPRRDELRDAIEQETRLDPRGELWVWSCPWCDTRFESRSQRGCIEQGVVHILEAGCDPSVGSGRVDG